MILSLHFLIFYFMAKMFVVSDIWFNRPYGQFSDLSTKEYNDKVIENWNSVVKQTDIVFVLGGLGISDLYTYFSKLNGEIHILGNVFAKDECSFYGFLRGNIDACPDPTIKNRFVFEDDQIIVLHDEDVVLSYFPLSDWGGKESGTINIHGFNAIHNFEEKSFTSMLAMHDFKPLSINGLKKMLKSIEKNVLK